MDKKIVIFVGCYGSGKTEWSINYAVHSVAVEKKVYLFDLDVVNPYFTVREYADEISKLGIRVVALSKDMKYVDLPVFNPSVTGLIRDDEAVRVVDVGGEPKGARVLSQVKGAIGEDEYDMFMVVNTRRPFTDSVKSIVDFCMEIEGASGMRITGLINNTNIAEFTDEEVVREGQVILEEVAKRTGVPVVYVSVASRELAEILAGRYWQSRVWLLRRYVRRCWEGGV